MRKHRRALAWAGFLAVVSLASAVSSRVRAEPEGSSIGAREAPIRALLARLTDSFNRGDVSGVSAAFTPDSGLITGDGTLVTSAPAIERFLSELQAKLPKGTQFMATVTNVRFEGPDVAVLTSEGGWLFPGETAIADKNQGIQSLVALRHQGTWKVALFQRTRRVPPPPAAK
jgi:uncharacterized protein (TIGR02246 family)